MSFHRSARFGGAVCASLCGALMAAVLGIAVPDAYANHIPGATYAGTHSDGGTVEFVISADGNSVASFKAVALPGSCGAECTCSVSLDAGGFPITEHAFSFREVSGAFPGAQSAQGHVGSITVAGEPACVSAEVAWSATTTATPPPPPPPPPDTVAPAVTLSFAAQRLRNAIANGVTLRAATSEAARVCGSLTLLPSAARRAGLRPTTTETRRGTVVVGSRCVMLTAAGTGTITLQFTKRAKRAFAKLVRARRILTLRASIIATDRAGNQGSAARQLRLAR